jgi:hypothetical protein
VMATKGLRTDAIISSKIHELILALPHHQSLLANKILAEGPWLRVRRQQCVLCKLLRVVPRVFPGL